MRFWPKMPPYLKLAFAVIVTISQCHLPGYRTANVTPQFAHAHTYFILTSIFDPVFNTNGFPHKCKGVGHAVPSVRQQPFAFQTTSKRAPLKE